ncbi:hypothetical protein ACVIU7_008803 [Bradyrhizobium liaoningense]|nr:hypothetical protein GCM10007858_33060 [Bradyrhizobium liaoningense]
MSAGTKGEGFGVKILKEIIKLRKERKNERDERESLLDLYMHAMETASPEQELWRNLGDDGVRKAAYRGG